MTVMPMFEKPEQRDAWVAENATLWALVRGRFNDPKERHTFCWRAAAEEFAVENPGMLPWMLYAQAPTGTWFHITNLR